MNCHKKNPSIVSIKFTTVDGKTIKENNSKLYFKYGSTEIQNEIIEKISDKNKLIIINK